MGVLYFDQLSGAVGTQKLVKNLFLAVFKLFWSSQTFLGDFSAEIKKKRLNTAKKSLKNFWNEQKRLKIAKKLFWPAFGCAQHLKAGWNTQQMSFLF